MKRSSEEHRLPESYEKACNNPEVIVLGCHHLDDSYLCPRTCCLARQEPGRLEGSSSQIESILN